MHKARVEAVCMTGPSARGSLNGIPTSIMDMPRRCSVRIMREVSSAEMLPAQKYRDNSPPLFSIAVEKHTCYLVHVLFAVLVRFRMFSCMQT